MVGAGEAANGAVTPAEQDPRDPGATRGDEWQSGWTNWWQGFWNGDEPADGARQTAIQWAQSANTPVND